VEDDRGRDSRSIHVGDARRVVLQPRNQAGLVAALQEPLVDLIGVADPGRLAELLGLLLPELGLRLAERPLLVGARLGRLGRPPREQPVRFHLRDEAIEVVAVLRLAVLAELVRDRRADVTVGGDDDVPIARRAHGGQPIGVNSRCSALRPRSMNDGFQS
jgi:hypothetical protein